eukprot:5211614-Pleurochrysis_carterae.AAC.1
MDRDSYYLPTTVLTLQQERHPKVADLCGDRLERRLGAAVPLVHGESPHPLRNLEQPLRRTRQLAHARRERAAHEPLRVCRSAL